MALELSAELRKQLQASIKRYFVEHLDAKERIHFVNEAHRVLRPGGQMHLVTPDWSSCRAYGDLTHKWPPVSEFWFFYLDKDWRAANAPRPST